MQLLVLDELTSDEYMFSKFDFWLNGHGGVGGKHGL
jgi:hypothetical protein